MNVQTVDTASMDPIVYALAHRDSRPTPDASEMRRIEIEAHAELADRNWASSRARLAREERDNPFTGKLRQTVKVNGAHGKVAKVYGDSVRVRFSTGRTEWFHHSKIETVDVATMDPIVYALNHR